MTIKRWIVAWGIATFLGMAHVETAPAYADESEEGVVQIKLKEAPKAVQSAIRSASKGAKGVEIYRETDGDVTLYEARWEADEVEHEIVLTVTGDTMQTEEVVDADDVPKAVRSAARAELPKGAKVTYEKMVVTLYEVIATVEDEEVEFLVDPLGRKVELDADEDEDDEDEDDEDEDDEDEDEDDEDEDEGDDEDIEVSQAPKKVQSAIKAVARGVKDISIDKETEDGVTLYEASWEDDEVEHELVVTSDGFVMQVEHLVSGDDIPKAVRTAAKIKDTKVKTTVVEKKVVTLYEVLTKVDGKEVEFLFDPLGRPIEIEVAKAHPKHGSLDKGDEGDEDDEDDDEDEDEDD